MPLITILEIFYLFILVAVVAYVFMGVIPTSRRIIGLGLLKRKKFDWNEFKFAAIVAAPGIVLHELSHKFIAIAFGLSAQFYIWPTGIIIAVILKAINSPFILIAPGYVGISEGATTLQSVLISFGGPAVNLALWILCGYLLKTNLSRKVAIGVFLTKEINKLLFIFNMIPIPPLDGYKVIGGLLKLSGLSGLLFG